MFYWHNSGTIYVSQTRGNDINSGFSQIQDAYGNGPIRTLDRALEMVEQMRCAGNLRPVTVDLLEDYYLEKPLVFTKELHSVTLQSQGKRRKLIGGRKLTGWKYDIYNNVPCLSAQLPEKENGSRWDFTDLVVNGKFAQLTRHPKEGTLRAIRTEKDAKDGQSQPLFNPTKWFEAKKEDLAGVPDVVGSTVNFYHYWVDAHSPVESFDPVTGIVSMEHSSRFSINTRYGTDDGLVPMHQAAFRYFLTNVPSQFGKPGEWFLDSYTGTVYYCPETTNADPDDMEAYVPILTELVEICAEDVRLRNLELMCTRGEYVSRMIDGNISDIDGFASDSQSVCWAPGAVRFENAVRGGIFDCYLHSLGIHGIEIKKGCRHVRIENNCIEDICAGGISVYGGEAEEPENTMTYGLIIRGNRISHCGVRYAAGNGILVRHASDIEIAENEIYDLEYSGITAGWVWGYAPSSTYGIIIRRNHIHHIGKGNLADLGGIYLLGKQRGTVISENRIHDIYAVVYGGWGIYTDEGCSYTVVENNVVFNTWSESYHHHYGCGNLVRNNIFAFGGSGCVKASRHEPHDGFLMENNILVTKAIPFFASVTTLQPVCCSKNLYWDVNGEPMLLRRNGGKVYTYSDRVPQIWGDSYDFFGWTEKLHKDAGSVVADPMFEDLENRDFRLMEGSPAIRLGFQPIEGFPAMDRKGGVRDE